MSFQVNIPPSLGAKLAKTEKGLEENAETSEPTLGLKKREDWKKIKELEEARKAGTAPAMQDEEGRDINPHIPQYIMQAPWYIGAMQPTLKHQREPDERKKNYSELNDWYKKGVQEGIVATKYRKGACENCGAITHKKKECLERPRHIGAKYTGTNMAPDEHEQPNLELTYDGKRDRWNGYNTDKHQKIFEEFQRLEEVKRELKSKKLENSFVEKETDDMDMDDDDDDDKYADDMAMPGTKFETKQRITVRNLRIREDTAKYLYNLDPNSAFYDPKTRSMRENPHRDTGIDPSEMPYAGDNFVRYSGDALEIAKQQMFAWEAYEKGTDVHIQADPTRLELLNREHQKKKDSFKDEMKSSILERYGGQEHLNAPPKQLLIAQTEEYVEYSRHGTLLKGSEKAGIRSRYEENIIESNHTCVWGSYWKEGMWGYKCCQSLVRGSYCIGTAALKDKLQLDKEKEQEDEEIRQKEIIKNLEEGELEPEPDANKYLQKSLLYQHLEKLQGEEKKMKKKVESILRKRRKKKQHSRHKKHKKERSSSAHDSEEEREPVEQDNDANELAKAIEAELRRLKEGDTLVRMDDRKRSYNVTYNHKAPTEYEMEAYKRLRVRDDDPMAKFLHDEALKET